MTTLEFTTQLGAFSILLHTDQAPVTCKYFADLVSHGEFNDSKIFRIVSTLNQAPDNTCPIHVVQVGSDSNLSSKTHTITHEGTNVSGLLHRKWTVSAARFVLGELYGSFFICMRDEPELDFGGTRQPDGRGFAAFGQITAGFETVEKLYQRAESEEILANGIPVSAARLVHASNNTSRSFP